MYKDNKIEVGEPATYEEINDLKNILSQVLSETAVHQLDTVSKAARLKTMKNSKLFGKGTCAWRSMQ